MSAYSMDWLALREAADAGARSRHLTGMLAGRLHGPVEAVDLGAGTGANVRYLAPRLSGPQHWQLLDHDAALLARARQRCSALHAADGRAVTLTTRCLDLADLPVLDLAGVNLLTASALLDLVGEHWITGLVEAARVAHVTVLIALSYSGGIAWEPAAQEDEAVRTAFNAHQRVQQPFAEPALGPDAGTVAADAFAAAGFQVHRDVSEWSLGQRDPRLLHALVDDWVAVACEQVPASAQAFSDWAGLRHEQIDNGRLRVRVSHLDFLALPDRAG